MPSFGKQSNKLLAEAHPDLQRVMREAIKYIDFSIIKGYRGKAEQEAAFKSGASKAHFGQSPHNFKPALAIDFIPYPFKGWSNTRDFNAVGMIILREAAKLGIEVTWGKSFKSIVDYPHFELKNWRKMK